MIAAPNVLAFETSSERLSVALVSRGARFHRSMEESTRHSEHILVVTQSLLDEAGVDLGELDAVAFGAGPGAFTGLRLGCGVAQGLALALELPVVAVNSLQALAENYRRTLSGRAQSGPLRIVTAIDARLGEVYFAAWHGVAGAWGAELETSLAKPEALPIPLGSGWIGCGNAFAVHGDAISQRLGNTVSSVASVAAPNALAVLEIALVEIAAGRATSPESALPLYVRDNVAFTVAERAARAASK